MSHISFVEPGSQIPFKFSYPYQMIWFLAPEGYIDGYMFNYGSFRPVNEQAFVLRLRFNTPLRVPVVRPYIKRPCENNGT